MPVLRRGRVNTIYFSPFFKDKVVGMFLCWSCTETPEEKIWIKLLRVVVEIMLFLIIP